MGSKEAAISWTKDQQKVISLRNRNILVSAAAGSGKTAVLVERIIQMISDTEHPVDIDRLLVVTFTNAAAAEMSERIATALEKKVEKEPDNLHLRRQIALVRNAHICTFHSFCQSVIRNHFNEIGIDPAFRVGDETELKLMKREIIGDIFEQHYAEYNKKKKATDYVMTPEDKAFVQLVECYSGAKSDEGLIQIVLQLYEFAMSDPWPEEWLEDKKKFFSLESIEQMEETKWIAFLKEYVSQVLNGLLLINQEALEMTNTVGGPQMYRDMLVDDQEILERLQSCSSYTDLAGAFSEIEWATLSRKKDDSVDPEKREYVKALRDKVKKAIEDLKKKFFFQGAEDMYVDMIALQLPMNTLLDLVKEFKNVFAEKKEEKRIVDFNDLEHNALKILVNPETKEPSQVAEIYREHFAELMVDEYQDSNEVQETILRSICKIAPEKPNVFMVGDVKQSIYKFRMARPELFMKKYDTYSLEDDDYQRVDLDRNFRSREIVLDTVNQIFRAIMRRSLGKVEYDKHAELYLGNTSFPEGERSSKDTELLLYIPQEDEEIADDTEEEDGSVVVSAGTSKVELEARMVAVRIKELVDGDNGLQVVDKKSGELRKCEYGDIAILLRSMSGWSDTYLEILKRAGIPVYTDTRSGYFSTYEIQTILQLLKVLDNPRQDIPLAAVMRSMIGGFTAEELAVMRSRYPDSDLVDTVAAYRKMDPSKVSGMTPQEGALSERAKQFLGKIEEYRRKVAYTPIHELLEWIYEDSGFYDYVSVMPNGAQRRDNLDMLVQKALNMEATSLSTLFHFNRYIEKLHKYEVDFGEASGGQGTQNAVHIMSIHKSKGLEFPVVIVGAMAKNFNNQDARSKLVLHLETGVGADVIDYEARTKMPSLIKRVISQQNILENLGEELRVLYVALTRAKEKLIMAGFLSKAESMERWHLNGEVMEYFVRVNAKNYLDWVGPVVADGKDSGFTTRVFHLGELVGDEVKEQVKAALKKEELLQWNTEVDYDLSLKEQLEKYQSFQYAFEKEKAIKSKMTVSELKHIAMQELAAEEFGLAEFQEELKPQSEEQKLEIPLPKFLQEEEEKIVGASRGTVYHKVFEKLRFSEISIETDVAGELQRMCDSGFLTEKEKSVVRAKDIYKFVTSNIGKQMAQAQERNAIWREQPFVFGIPAKEVKTEWDSEELVLIQGIIDAYYEIDGELVIVDYKTDRVSNGEELKKRYQTQLDYYEKALEQITHKKVKEKYLYSVTLGEEIKLD